MAQIDACIYGRKIRKLFDNMLKPIREANNLKQIEVEIILYFYENEGKTASDLYRELGLNKGQVSTAIESLCGKEILKTYNNPGDRRSLRYELLDKGKLIAMDMDREINKVYAMALEGVSKENIKSFYETGTIICKNVDKYVDKDREELR